MRELAKRLGRSFLLVLGIGATASTASLLADSPAGASSTAFERRLADASVKGAAQHVGSALIASGRDATREASRNALGEWYWAFHADVRLEPDVREAAEIEFDESFELVATTIRDRKIDSLMLIGIDDVATPRCMRWHYLSIGPKGPALFSVVVYQASEKPRLRDLRVLTGLAEVEAAVDAIEHSTGDQIFTIQVAPPRTDAAPGDPDSASEKPAEN